MYGTCIHHRWKTNGTLKNNNNKEIHTSLYIKANHQQSIKKMYDKCTINTS